MSSLMDLDNEEFYQQVAQLNEKPFSKNLKRSFSEYEEDVAPWAVPSAAIASEQTLPPRAKRRIGGFRTIITACIDWVIAAFRQPIFITGIPTDSSGAKRRAVDCSPSSTPIRRLPGAFPAPTPSMTTTPPPSRPSSSQDNCDMKPVASSPPKIATPVVADIPPATSAVSAAVSPALAAPKPTWRERRGPLKPRDQWRPTNAKELEVWERKFPKPIALPTIALPRPYPTPVSALITRDAKKAQTEADRDANVTSLVERAKKVQLESPMAAAIRQEEKTAYQLRQEAHAAAQKAAEEEAAALRLALEAEARAEAQVKQEAEEARLKELAAQEEVDRRAREAEEAATQLRVEREAQEQLEAKAAKAAADLEQLRSVLIRPLEPKWDEKVKAVMNSNNNRVTVATTVDGVDLKRPDFMSLLPEPGHDKATGWLNDEIVNAFYSSIVAEKKEQTGWKKGAIPAIVAFNTGWITTYRNKGLQGIKSWGKRVGVKGDRLLQAEKIFFPINTGVHWMLLVLSPQARTIEYIDSLPNKGQKYFEFAREWLAMELGDAYVADEWTEMATRSSLQQNGDDCGAFTCLNGLAAAKGYGFESVQAEKMQDGRRMIGAVLLNGGFHGDWRL